MNETTLIKNIFKHIKLSQEELSIFENFWTEKTLEKGEFLLRNGDVCRYDNYVVLGALKAFYINSENGNEEILYFAIDNWWASDLDSFSKKKPSIITYKPLKRLLFYRLIIILFKNYYLKFLLWKDIFG